MLFNNRKRKQVILSALCVVATYLVLFHYRHHRPTVFPENPPPPEPVHRCFAAQERKTVTFRDDNIINPRFSYPINAQELCQGREVEVVMPVHSAITNFRRRDRTRKFRQGKYAENKENNVALIFFVGLPSEKLANGSNFQTSLKNESSLHGDIVQINVTDTYRNIVFKAIAVLQWVNTYCSHADFVLKMDDDVLVDPSLLLLSLYKFRNFYSEFIVGELRTGRKPERNDKIKWHMPEGEYTNSTYPPFVPGPVLGYPTTTARLLYQQALRTKTIWLDDVFITGICSQILGIPVLNDVNFGRVHRPMITKNFIYQ